MRLGFPQRCNVRIDVMPRRAVPCHCASPPPRRYSRFRASRSARPPQRVLLTGASGFLGAHILASLLRDTHVDVFCLVRAGNEAEALVRLEDTLKKYVVCFWRRLVQVASNRSSRWQCRRSMSTTLGFALVCCEWSRVERVRVRVWVRGRGRNRGRKEIRGRRGRAGYSSS